jgi:hypothetical protein
MGNGDLNSLSNRRPQDFVTHGLVLTAHRESGRLHRLCRCVGALALSQPGLLIKIGRFHDHKGIFMSYGSSNRTKASRKP